MPVGAMSLTLPTEHGSADVWSEILDAALAVISDHDHRPGSGNRITPAAMIINADLNFLSSAATNMKALKFSPQQAVNVGSYAQALYVNSTTGELTWRSQAGASVTLTSGSTINASLLGGITLDYATVGASFGYDNTADRYLAQQEIGSGVRQWAGLAMGQLDIYQQLAAPAGGVPVNRVRLKSPASLAASLDLTMPPALPSATTLLAIDSTGAITAPSPTVTLGSNVNIQLQGTGLLKHGTRSVVYSPMFNSAITLSGSGPSQPAGVPGAVCAVSSQVMFPLPAYETHWRVTTVVITLGAAAPANAPTYDLYFSDTGAGTAAFSHSGITGVTTTATTITLTLNTNYTSPLWLSVQTAASTVHVKTVTVNYDVP